MAHIPWWNWLVVFGLIGGLGMMAIAKQGEFVIEARRRGCLANLRTIDKVVAVWESQYVGMPADRDLWIDLKSDGRIARVSPDLEAFQAGMNLPPQAVLKPGSEALMSTAGDTWTFMCPERWNHLDDLLGREKLVAYWKSDPEVLYRWMLSPAPRKELRGRQRGTLCLLHGELGIRRWPGLEHTENAGGF